MSWRDQRRLCDFEVCPKEGIAAGTVAGVRHLACAQHALLPEFKVLGFDWTIGPPTQNGRHLLQWGAFSAEAITHEWVQEGREDHFGRVIRHVFIPEPTKTPVEPKIDCCSFGRDNIKAVNGKWDMTITVEHPGGKLKTYSLTPPQCLCGTILPQLNQGSES